MHLGNLPDPLYIILILTIISLAPFIAIMVTSFIKLVIVLSLVRNALGIQQIPPNIVINGLAIILTLYIMAPVGQNVFVILQTQQGQKKDVASLVKAVDKAKEPIRKFLEAHSRDPERAFFLKSAKAIWPKKKAENLKENDLIILVPSFAVSELTSAFEIGLLLYLPFIAIDLIVSNILLAMGMMMVSPMTISLPFKLLLFVLLNGWARLIHGLILTYG